ncbi:MAG: putative zinc-binding metallopeptidase [Halioglobus sp.]
MKRFYCECGSQVFFENNNCLNCSARLGFDPDSMDMLAVHPGAGGVYHNKNGAEFRFCGNGESYDVCNWLRPSQVEHPLCTACQFNRTIPNQDFPENRSRWRTLEVAKKRLFFTLMQLHLPLKNGWSDPQNGLLLDFVEDGRSRADVFPESFLSTGYLGGVITINVLEADDAARAAVREKMNEDYRTVLGHLRHESGHYFWSRLNPDTDTRAQFAKQFGDENRDYKKALDAHYKSGPSLEWRQFYISAYASSHPSEDWAESWGHYLHIYDALDTAASQKLIEQSPADMNIADRIAVWQDLSITLNEMNRSVGLGDAYPFVINKHVARKLTFVDAVICQLQEYG